MVKNILRIIAEIFYGGLVALVGAAILVCLVALSRLLTTNTFYGSLLLVTIIYILILTRNLNRSKR